MAVREETGAGAERDPNGRRALRYADTNRTTTLLAFVGVAFALGWLATPDIDFGAVFRAGTRAWLLGYFAPAELGGVRIAITPLGLTALTMLVGTWFAGFAASRATSSASRTATLWSPKRAAECSASASTAC